MQQAVAQHRVPGGGVSLAALQAKGLDCEHSDAEMGPRGGVSPPGIRGTTFLQIGSHFVYSDNPN